MIFCYFLRGVRYTAELPFSGVWYTVESILKKSYKGKSAVSDTGTSLSRFFVEYLREFSEKIEIVPGYL